MTDVKRGRSFVLLRRELQEYRNSLVLTPVIISSILVLVMLASVLLANRISVMGDAILDVLMQEEAIRGMNITIKIDDDGDGPANYEYHIQQQSQPVVEDDWDFSKQWNFNPSPGDQPAPETDSGELKGRSDSLNPLLTMIHNLMLLVMILVSVNYLLACLFTDRKDRSILFWKSLPVSEWEEVLSKFALVILVVPAVYIAVSMLTQLVCTGLAMLLVWRMDKDPFELVLGNVDFLPLFLNQLGGWLKAALLVAPLYGWLMLASAAARRSPFLFAVAPVVALFLLERIFLGSGYLAAAVSEHIPHYLSGDSAAGMHSYGPEWSSLSVVTVGLGLLLSAAALWGAVYLRRYRFEI